MTNPIDALDDRSTDTDGWLWVASALTFVVGDVITTVVGLSLPGVTETHPVGSTIVDFGPLLMVGMKAMVLAVAVGFYFTANTKYRTAIPASLTAVGALITGSNLAIILFATA